MPLMKAHSNYSFNPNVSFSTVAQLYKYTITGMRKCSTNLPQGGLELPCNYTFNDPAEDTAKKVKQRLIEEDNKR